jgi:outer membrane cobalamin receptor
VETRDHAGFWGGSGNLSIGSPLASGRLSAHAAASYQDAGVPGSLSYPSSQAEQQDSSLNGSLGWSSDALADGSFTLDIKAHGGFSRLDYADPSYSENDRHDMANGGMDLRAVKSLSLPADLGFGASLLYEAANSSAFDSNPGGQPSRFSLGAYIEPELRVGDRLKIKPALRYDWNDNYAAGFSAMLGAVWKASDAVALRLSGGRSYRAPTFNELYWPYSNYWGSITGGNPDLLPEVAWSGELGVDLRVERLSLLADVSARYVDDLITSRSPESYDYTPVNIDTAFVPDASIEAAYRVGPATIKASYEFLYPLDLSGGQTIADKVVLKNFSQNKAGASVNFEFGAAEAGIDANYWSDRVSSGQDLVGVAIVDLNAAYKVRKGIRFNIAVNNLLDSDYQITSDYPMPGLTLKVGAKIDL